MSSQPAAQRLIRFGLFELDVSVGELRRQGRQIKLQDQPLQVLELLLRRPGEIVTRDELQKALWPADTFVEFDQGLNTAIKKIRLALGDSADNPRFVETIPRKGYRFIAPVEPASQQANVTPPTPRRSRRRFTLLWAPTVAALLLAAGVWFVRSRTAKPEPSLVAVPLTTYPGIEDTPSFSPDGTQVAFQWCPGNADQGCHIYIKQVGIELPFQLTNNPARDFSPAWSPDGQTIAFLRILTPTKWGLILKPQRGGRERVLEEIDVSGMGDLIGGSLLAWAPDSKWIVLPGPTEQRLYGLSLLSVETGEKRRLTVPAVEIGDCAPAFSPDGRTLAFTRWIAGRNDLYVLHLAEGYKPQGEPERLALDNLINTGAAWTADGRDIVFSSGTGNSSGLWRLPVRNLAAPRRLGFASDNASGPSVSRQGNRLAYVVNRSDTNIWRVDLRGPGGKPGSPAQFISSTKPEWDPGYSPDGKRIAFVSQRSGADEVWMCDSDGSNPVPLTSFGGAFIYGPRWSPDGGSIGFTVVAAGKVDMYAVNANGGKSRRLTSGQTRGGWPYWSRNGQWLYFASVGGGQTQIWRMPAKGGEAVQITRNGGDKPEESPDGKFIYYNKGWPRELSIWRVPVEGGEEVKVLDSVNPFGRWTVGQLGIYYFSLFDKQGHSDIRLYEFSTGKITKIVTIERKPDWDLSVSPDGRTILYSQVDENGSDLMLVENFR